jgi:amino acid transporter
MDDKKTARDLGSEPIRETETSLQSGGLGLGIGLTNVVAYIVLPALIAVGIWTLVCVYAIVKWIGSAPDDVNPTVIVLGVAGLVTLLVVLIAVGVGLIGRSMNPKRRDDR